MDTNILLKILDISIKKHGANKPLTLGHLRNIIALSERNEEFIKNCMEDEVLIVEKDLYNECCDPNK